MSQKRLWAGVTAAALVAAGNIALPQSGGVPDCTSTTFNYVSDAPQNCVVPGKAGSYQSIELSMFGAGGGAAYSGEYARGGNSGRIDFVLNVPAGAELELYIPRGGYESNYNNNGDGAGGGGSAGIVYEGTVIAEAGGGGGAANGVIRIDPPDEPGGSGGTGPSNDQGGNGGTACSGQGGNQDGAGAGGAGGPVDLTTCKDGLTAPYPISGQTGGSGLTGNGGDGAVPEGAAGLVLESGGFGLSKGGDGGQGLSQPGPDFAGGAGGGGGYGDGGGGSAQDVDYDYATGSGGGGGVMWTPGTPAVSTSGSKRLAVTSTTLQLACPGRSPSTTWARLLSRRPRHRM